MSRRARQPGRLPRVSRTELLILELLGDHGPRYGLWLVEHSGGRLKRGTVYVTLGRMEDKGLVESYLESREPGVPGLPRRFYRLARAGVAVLRAAELAQALLLEPELAS
jgi:DNA-binding PadR family transcriptional regulator